MARRISRGGDGGSAEVVGFYDARGRWNYRNPRNGHWYRHEGGKQRPGQRGGPTDRDLARGRTFGIRYQRPDGSEPEHRTVIYPDGGIDLEGDDLYGDMLADDEAGYYERATAA